MPESNLPSGGGPYLRACFAVVYSNGSIVAHCGRHKRVHSGTCVEIATRRCVLRPQGRRHPSPICPQTESRSGHPSHSHSAKPPAPGNPMSSSCDRLKFCRRGSVKRSPRLFRNAAHVVGLENIAAKEDTSRSRSRNVADHIQCMFVRGMTASTEHQNWYGTFFHHRTHGGVSPL